MYTFREIWGNSALVRHLQTAAAGGRVSHAYLFTGGAGAGKRMFANTFAKALQCEGAGERPCCTCASCTAFDSGNHPDVIYVRTEKKSIGVDEIREQILETVNLKPYRFACKIYIMENADTMTVQAQNALLKTLEEPPVYARFLLLAERAEAFLPTILSRVAVMPLRPLPEQEIAAYLREKAHVPAEACDSYAAYAQGRIGRALDLLQDEDFQQLRQDILQKVQALPGMSEADVLAMAKDLEGYKNDLRFLDIMELWYRDLLAAKCLKTESMKVYRCLKEGNLPQARRAVSMIVGRDTECLDEAGVAKAAVETVAENTSDGVIAPMLYLALGGPVLGFFYKAVNTMDSMVGYKNISVFRQGGGKAG